MTFEASTVLVYKERSRVIVLHVYVKFEAVAVLAALPSVPPAMKTKGL
jgi:hypothetical protein